MPSIMIVSQEDVMRGIVSYHCYIPWYRLDRKAIYEQLGWFNKAGVALAKGEKSVANQDEDAVTMAVSSSAGCIEDGTKKNINCFYMASTSFPFTVRQNAVIASKALNLPTSIRTADFGGSTKSGTTALLTALDSTSNKTSLVCASESRIAKPGSVEEYTYGDGAASLLVGSEDVIAEFKGSYSISHDFVDYRRVSGERFSHSWEERWIREEGYEKLFLSAIEGLLKKYNIEIKNFKKIAVAYPNTRSLRKLAKTLGATEEQIQDNYLSNIGDTGAAMPLMMLAEALETAKPGDKILMISYGSGCDALYFQVTDKIENIKRGYKGVSKYLKFKNELNIYSKYLVFRNLLPIDIGIRGESVFPTSMNVLWRKEEEVLSLMGSKCKVCETPQYPKQRVCINPDCGAIDQMEDYLFSDKKGKLFSFTGDNLAFSYDPPQIYGTVDFEKGGRIPLDLTDCIIDSLTVGTPVSLSFRKKYSDIQRGYFGYFWKAIPENKKEEE